jgi:RNA polymerase sigma factor (sigma-70 family)
VDDSDESLARRAAAGEEAAFADLVARHADRLRAWVRLRGGPGSARESCSDVVQSVLVRVHEDLAEFEDRGPGSFRNWLLAYARGVLQNHRRSARAARRSPDREDDRSLSQVYRSVHTPSRAAAAREEVERFERAFASLDEDERELILLARIEGLSHAEIAERTGRTEVACRKALSRALFRLSARLD